MSLLQNDRKVVQDGRQNTLQDAEVPLRDRIVNRLYEKLTSDDVKMGVKLTEAWTLATTNMQTILDKQQTFMRDLNDFGIGAEQNAFGGQSNLHIPMTFTVVKTYHARFMEALIGLDPMFSVKPRREDATDSVTVVEDLMRYTLLSWANQYKGIEEELDPWVWDWCAAGWAVLKSGWATVWESYEDVVEVRVPTAPLWQVMEDGTQVAIPQYEMQEKEERVTKKTFEGPTYRHIQIEDFRMVGGRGDPDKADIVMERQYPNASELWTKVDQRVFKKEAVEKVINGGADSEYSGLGNNLKQERAQAEGKTVLDTEVDLDRYSIVEAIFQYDVDGSGINSDIVAWVDLDTSTILGCTYLRRISPTGGRPYSVIHFHKRPGEEFGLGLGEILHPMAVELDAMHNIRIDNALYQSIPFFVYRASSSLDASTISIEPGMGIPVDNINDISFPQIPNRTIFTGQEEATIQSYVERLTGISDLSLGVMTGTQGPTRTASGVRAMLGENNNNMSVHLRRLNRGWNKTLSSTLQMLQTRLPDDFCFRVTGNDGKNVFYDISRDDIAFQYDFELSANTSNSNKSVQIEVSQQVMAIASNPLNIQLGLSGPNEIYAAQKAYLSNIGVKDVHRFIKKPADYSYALSAEEEFNRIVRGQPVRVHPGQDHNGFIAFAQAMLDLQQTFNTLTPDQQDMLTNQMAAHQQMAAALEQQAAQQAVKQQMQYNAQQALGGSEGPMNPLQGADPGAVF